MNKFMIIVLMLNLLGCASDPMAKLIPQKGKIEQEIKSIKNIAIVAYETREITVQGLKGKLIGSAIQQAQNISVVETELSKNLYNDLAAELSKTGFRVAPIRQLIENKYYQSLNTQQRSAQLLSLNANQRVTIANGIVRSSFDGLQFSKEERDRLYKELNVDALVYARISYFMPKDFNPLGLGQSFLQPTITFFMYKPSIDEPIWFLLNQAGPKSTESIGRFSGLEDQSLIDRESRLLAQQTMNLYLSK